MTTSPTTPPLTNADVARALNSIFDKRIDEAGKNVTRLKAEILGIKSLSHTSEEQERKKALGPAERGLANAEERFKDWQREVGWYGMSAPMKMLKKSQIVRKTRKEYETKISTFESDVESSLRATTIDLHNASVDTEQNKLTDLRESRTNAADRKATYEALREKSEDAIRAASSDSWLDKNFRKHFYAMAVHIQEERISEAEKILSTLIFQRQPTNEKYETWTKEAKKLFDNAYSTYAGYPASIAYTVMATSSVALVAPHLRDEVTRKLEDFSHISDRWQVLGNFLQDPRKLKTDVIWALYWSMFQTGQWMSNSLNEAQSHEDIQTGELYALLDRGLTDWCAPRMGQFGYPENRSYLGTFKIASTTEETILGADMGLIVDINVGDLKCRKVALFQAKKAVLGTANIGSTSSQLQKLSTRPNIGYYLFYHLPEGVVSPPAPTICTAFSLAEIAKAGGRDLEAKSLSMDVRELGWDFAHFITFGLCDAQSGYGETFETLSEAFNILGNGSPGTLPSRLAVIAITDESAVSALRKEIVLHYRPMQEEKQLQKEKSVSRDKDSPAPGRT